MGDRIHRLIVQETGEPGVWELECPECSFRGIYTRLPEDGQYVIRILDRGNEEVIHTSSGLESLGRQEPHPAQTAEADYGAYGMAGTPAAAEDLESWLTPELRRQIQEVLEPLDF